MKPLPNQGMRCIICASLIEGQQAHDRILCDNMECTYDWKRLKEGKLFKYTEQRKKILEAKRKYNHTKRKDVKKRNKNIFMKEAKQLTEEYYDWIISTRQYV